MMIANQDALRSLIQESGRQTDFYRRKGLQEVSEFWAELESLAFRARTSGQVLIVGLQEIKPLTLIKGGE